MPGSLRFGGSTLSRACLNGPSFSILVMTARLISLYLPNLIQRRWFILLSSRNIQLKVRQGLLVSMDQMALARYLLSIFSVGTRVTFYFAFSLQLFSTASILPQIVASLFHIEYKSQIVTISNLERVAIFLNVMGSLPEVIASNLLTIKLRVYSEILALARRVLAFWIFQFSLRLLSELPEKELISEVYFYCFCSPTLFAYKPFLKTLYFWYFRQTNASYC